MAPPDFAGKCIVRGLPFSPSRANLEVVHCERNCGLKASSCGPGTFSSLQDFQSSSSLSTGGVSGRVQYPDNPFYEIQPLAVPRGNRQPSVIVEIQRNQVSEVHQFLRIRQ